MNALGSVAAFGVGFPGAVLLLSYAAIAAYTGNAWLWPVIVHESGDRTLLQTILYYEHAARELPLDLILGVVVGASARFVLPPPRVFQVRRHLLALRLALGASVFVIIAGTVLTGGWTMLYDNLLQFPTRPGEPPVWGGHWRYHLLSHVGLMLCSFGLAAPVMLAAGQARGFRRGLRLFGGALGVFFALTLLFAPASESFRDPVFLGHQAREAFTHGLVTVPLAWAMCLFLGRERWNVPATGTVSASIAWIVGAAGVAVGIFLAAAALATSAASQGQSDSLAVLIFPHFFEHTFSYLVATLAAGLAFDTAGSERLP